MNHRIDNGRKKSGGVWDGHPDFILDCWPCWQSGAIHSWVINAHPTIGGSLAGSKPTEIDAILCGVEFLLTRGESPTLIVDQLFPEERAALAEALFGWLG